MSLTRRKSLKRTELKARPMASKPPPRNTGPSKAVRLQVLERDGYKCAACGCNVISKPHSVQHRKARGSGGSSDPAINSPSNLILLCGSATTPGSCHLKCEQRDPHMHAAGFWLWSWQDPAAEPVLLHGAGSGMKVWLTPSGTYSTEPPEVTA